VEAAGLALARTGASERLERGLADSQAADVRGVARLLSLHLTDCYRQAN
jgi:hypothetical protein